MKLLQGLFEQLNEQKEKEAVSRVVGVERIHSSVSSWKLSFQRLILKEFEATQKYIEEGSLDSLYIQAQQDGTCRCKFYRFNQMPLHTVTLLRDQAIKSIQYFETFYAGNQTFCILSVRGVISTPIIAELQQMKLSSI